MTLDEQAELIISKLYSLIGDPRLSGLSVFVAACKIGATQRLAKRVEELWEGPNPLP